MRKYIFLLLFIPALCLAQNTADKVLAKAIAYHDSQGNWPLLSSTFNFTETRPNGPNRSTIVVINNSESYMKINRNDEEIYEVTLDDAKVLKGDKDQDRAIVLRNYYLYLWGLPMKLYDESTPEITLSADATVADKVCKVLRVAYEKDIWYFYFDDFSGRMIQYKFYQDAEETKGELITLEDEISVNGIKIPKKRSWYTLPDMKYLGTDILSSIN
ncbi:DUF6503 family protein [Ekhidna sp. To15]|uniref:DUF6503 family protein n=1 Tax=Ekhidna sp. To15 TaxID=3395267 RepID=UPI003F524F7D